MAKVAASKQKTSSEVAIRKSTAVALKASGIDIMEDAGQGFENVDKDSFAIPFLRVLQSGSPQCKKSSPEFIKGAEEGDFYNTVTKEVIPGAEGLLLIPVMYDRKYCEWAPNRGGFRGEHLPSAPILLQVKKKTNDEGKEFNALPNGNSVNDTRYHFCLHLQDDGTYNPVLICMSSSGLKVSKRLMTELNSVKCRNEDNRQFTPPMFLNKIRMTSIAESNDQGDWFNYNPEIVGQLDITDEDEAEIYIAAKAFRDSISAGRATVDHSAEDGGASSEGQGQGKF